MQRAAYLQTAFAFTIKSPHSLQARVPVLANDDVVVHGDAGRARHRDDRLTPLSLFLRARY